MTPQKTNANAKNTGPQQIPLGNGHVALVDFRDSHFVRNFLWKAVRRQRSWYARATMHLYAGPTKIYMHRLIAATPDGQVCHHRNRNSLDNRRSNLLNMPAKEHQMLHQNDTLLIRFEPPNNQ